jgi:hypothetical protein
MPGRPIIVLMKIPPLTLKIGDYPQLALLAWSRRPDDVITAEEAFGLYESNWRFVDHKQLDDQERELIDGLTETCGHGLMNV